MHAARGVDFALRANRQAGFAMDSTALSGFVGGLWDGEIVPQLTEYIRIPNKSPMFDAQWAEHGHMDRAVALMEALGARAADCRA